MACQSLDTRWTADGVQYLHDALGEIGRRQYKLNGRWTLVLSEGAPAETAARIFGDVTDLDPDACDWMALALVAELERSA